MNALHVEHTIRQRDSLAREVALLRAENLALRERVTNASMDDGDLAAMIERDTAKRLLEFMREPLDVTAERRARLLKAVS